MGCPSLPFISDEKTPETQTKQRAAEKLLNDVRRHEIVTLDGGHYLHWTQSKRMAELITTFLAKDH